MKYIQIALIWAALLTMFCIALVWLGGCTQVILEKDKLKINTLFMTSGIDTLYYDPNGIFEVNKYISIPSDMELYFDPLTKKIVLRTKANKLP